jgi:hypothetical protein
MAQPRGTPHRDTSHARLCPRPIGINSEEAHWQMSQEESCAGLLAQGCKDLRPYAIETSCGLGRGQRGIAAPQAVTKTESVIAVISTPAMKL